MQEHQQIIFPIIIAFLIVIIIGPIVIPILEKLKMGQSIRGDGPRTHFKKSGTPTMGGIIIVIAVFFSVLITAQWEREMLFILASILGFGCIGLVDDFIKVVMRRSLGLRATHKIIAQILLGIVLAIYAYRSPNVGSSVLIPFTSQVWDMGIWYIPFTAIIIFVGTVNSVNFTDGLDGLAAGITMIVMAFLSLVALKAGQKEIAIISAAVTGSTLGFLRYNSHPAQIFMGDTGSMALGGAVAAVVVLLKLPLLLPIIGGIYVLETLSIIIQVVSFRLTGRRIFLMAPLHHHYEVKGWEETKIVVVFWIITIVLVLVGVLAIR
ncbi:MAG: phospho-N-acetylmuramoyl-pentapeptide-transferase [Bacillota bacterium]|nr:phospho-N-acetylmuramoyl-pentapeptide-transferase [Bacillota bacterium]MDD3297549.1 phospho-N-acetylmuramoyl-pentapeptide-transferase [Bacillota bacterium]MDD3850203.1 phospho-N-acetylmuramoyl-pentapeptide-transferase [Bacillota bacterium]MDD4707254.1 phospho-N-acetylmuramoyl-pentapeptide-transferase [Bacillota bacterium]